MAEGLRAEGSNIAKVSGKCQTLDVVNLWPQDVFKPKTTKLNKIST